MTAEPLVVSVPFQSWVMVWPLASVQVTVHPLIAEAPAFTVTCAWKPPAGRPRLALGRAARERIRAQFTWEAKARQVLEVYRWVLGQRSDKPDFGVPFPDPSG